MAERTVYQHEAEPKPALPHLVLKERIGLCPLLICTHCAGHLALNAHTPHLRRAIDAFYETHQDCAAGAWRKQEWTPMEGTA